MDTLIEEHNARWLLNNAGDARCTVPIVISTYRRARSGGE